MIYFDNAATGGFKPRSVLDSVENVIKYLSANPARASHRLSITGQKLTLDCRNKISKFFNCQPNRVIFTKNCTEALNTAIFGVIKEGGHVITTVFEHNSVLRPLFALKKMGKISLSVVMPSINQPLEQAIKSEITNKTCLICATYCSNVTGEVLPINKIGEIAKIYKIPFLVDGAQGGGHYNIDIKKDNISMLALAGHKGLYGIMGSGLLILDDNIEVNPLIYGGTGSDTFNLIAPSDYPERLEVGTLNLPAVISLSEGVDYVSKNLSNFATCLYNNTKKIIEGLKNEKIKCYSKPNCSGIVAFSINNTLSTDIADILNNDFDIAVRGGFHCAPLMHKYLNTENCGLVRASIAVQNSSSEILTFIHAINKICQN